MVLAMSLIVEKALSWLLQSGIYISDGSDPNNGAVYSHFAYRLAQEPRRLWRRYLIENPPFVYHVIKERMLTNVPSTWES